jgi:hypothetical protein
MKTTKLFVFVLLTITMACTGSKKEKEAWTALKDQVMTVHDEIMPKMGELMSLRKQLEDKATALKESGADASEVEALMQISKDLDNSHEKMMQWMREYDPTFEGMVEQEIMTYLEDQKKKIERVGILTNESIEKAKQALQ